MAWENISFLIQCYQVLGDQRLLDPITRGMNFFLLSQQGAPNPGWSLQYTLDLKPAAARTYEPLALATHTTASNLEHLITFYELTGDTRYLARVPEGIDWLEKVKLAKPDAAAERIPRTSSCRPTARCTCTGAAPTSSTASTTSTTIRSAPSGTTARPASSTPPRCASTTKKRARPM